MNTVDKVEQVPKKRRGRPRKDKSTVMGDYIAQEAKKSRDRKRNNKVVEKYYQMVQGHKLCLCKRVASGSVYTTFIGSNKKKVDKDGRPTETYLKIKALCEKLQKEGKLRVKI